MDEKIRPSQKRIITVLGIAVACVFMLLISLLAQDLGPSVTPASLPTPTLSSKPSPTPTIDMHRYDEMCTDMRSLDLKRQAIRRTIETNEDFIRRIEIAFRQGILSEQDRQKAHALHTELEHYRHSLVYEYRFGVVSDNTDYPNLPEKVREWAIEETEINDSFSDELAYFTMVGEDLRLWRYWDSQGVLRLLTVDEFLAQKALQDHIFEQFMEQYCKE